MFVGSDVVVNIGWLEPLLAAVRDDPNALVASHTDNFLSGVRFFETPSNYLNMMTWTLSTVFLEASDSSSSLVATPVMKGHVFAVNKAFLTSIGDYVPQYIPCSCNDANITCGVVGLRCIGGTSLLELVYGMGVICRKVGAYLLFNPACSID